MSDNERQSSPWMAHRGMMGFVMFKTTGKGTAEGDGGGHAAYSPARHVGDEHGGDATHDRGQVTGRDMRGTEVK